MYVSGLYLILFLLSVFALNRLFIAISTRHSGYYMVLFSLISVVCLAYYSYSIAIDKSMALVSNQFTYFDGTFVMMFFIFCILDIMGIKLKSYIAIPWTILGLFFLLLPFSAGHNGIFYESYELVQDYGASHLTMEFGPWHGPFMVFVVINMLLPIVVVAISFFYKKKVSYKISIILSVLLIAIVALYFVEQISGLGFDILPCGYVLIEYVILGIINRITLYDVNKIALDANEDNKDYGCIIFDKKLNYMGANDAATYYFPELSKLAIDRTVNDEYVKYEFVDWIQKRDVDNVSSTKVLERKDRKILCTVKPYLNKKSQVYSYVIELRNDTEQQNLIEQINIANEDLAQAVEIANNANLAKSQFLANMSHEIRTPINAILGMNELAMRKCKDQDILECMYDIENAGKNLMGIINDILDFSKIEAGKIEIINDDYDIAKVIKEVEDMIGIKAKEKSLELIVNADSNLPSLLCGDEKRVRQIMINLLNNAVKYTHVGQVTFDILVGSRRDDEANIVIKVSDTGIGIKEENIGELFNSFSRVDEKNNKNIEGTGLGLAITQKLVKRMSGDISVKSVYGEGSEFLVILPQLVKDNTPIGNYKEKYKSIYKKHKEITEVDATGKNILVVDDNLINLKIAEGLLETTHANVTLSESGKEALELMSKNYYDLILLDHMMPEMDGVEVLKTARCDDGCLCKNSVFVVLTANAINGVQEEYAAAGFDDYLSKPIDPTVFINTVDKYVNKAD